MIYQKPFHLKYWDALCHLGSDFVPGLLAMGTVILLMTGVLFAALAFALWVFA